MIAWLWFFDSDSDFSGFSEKCPSQMCVYIDSGIEHQAKQLDIVDEDMFSLDVG